MLSFLVGLSVRQTLPPVGESIGVVASFTSSGVRLISSIVVIFSPASPDCIICKNRQSLDRRPGCRGMIQASPYPSLRMLFCICRYTPSLVRACQLQSAGSLCLRARKLERNFHGFSHACDCSRCVLKVASQFAKEKPLLICILQA